MRTKQTIRQLASAILGLALTAFAITPAAAQSVTLDLASGGGDATGRIIQLLALLTVLSLAPAILVMVTSFTRIIVVLSFLRTALGIQQTPPNQVLISLALFLTFFVMQPTLDRSWEDGVRPLIEGTIDEGQAFERALAPVRTFMAAHVRPQDLALFEELSGSRGVAGPAGGVGEAQAAEGSQDDLTAESAPIRVLIPAFMISELRRAFEIGFLVFVPFLIIDMVVSSVLMSMGMMMLPPVTVALPFKVIFFVLVDGWFLIVGSLVRSFSG
jgi:flagellar biosynthetic protein FliP